MTQGQEANQTNYGEERKETETEAEVAAGKEAAEANEAVEEVAEPLFHICGVSNSPLITRRTDGPTDARSHELQQKDNGTSSSESCRDKIEGSTECSDRMPTKEQRFVNPMERLRRRTELEIKESGYVSETASSPSSSMNCYGFPHKRSGEQKYCR